MNRIKTLREEKKIFQKDLAEFLNVSIPAINYYENEKRAMDTETASKLANYFDVSIDYLLGKSDVRNPIDINNVQFANNGGINTDGLDPDEIDEIQKQVEYMKWKKEQGKKE